MLRALRTPSLVRHCCGVRLSSSRKPSKFNPKALFTKGKYSSKEITAVLRGCHQELTFNDISDVLYISSKNRYTLSPDQLDIVATSIRNITSSGVADTRGISKFFYGLQRQNSENKTILKLLRDMHAFVTSPHRDFRRFNGHEIGMMVYGFQRMRTRHQEVCSIVNFFTEAIKECDDTLNASHLSVLFYGINHFDSNHIEVRTLALILSFPRTTLTTCWMLSV
mmetsp:Transcript_12178/g.22570  ORF Transcript_12178/g.22570 Transcript_12178/m.22570 type:complete len:223 (-) Transcript_12178:215-883(-)